MTIEDRIKKRTVKDKSGCWLWTGATCNGYGVITISKNKKAVKYVHRVYWELVNGPIPKDMFVCHTCDIRNCFNPEHLFLGTPTDNQRDMISKGRKSRIRWNTTITHCKHGHLFDEKNTYCPPNHKERVCRMCQRASSKKHYYKNKSNG